MRNYKVNQSEIVRKFKAKAAFCNIFIDYIKFNFRFLRVFTGRLPKLHQGPSTDFEGHPSGLRDQRVQP